jgi:hypothetical protein
MGHKRVEKGTMHVRVALLWGDFAHEGRLVPRHYAGMVALAVEVRVGEVLFVLWSWARGLISSSRDSRFHEST